MHTIADEDHRFVRGELKRDEALQKFEKEGEAFKVELIQGLPDPTVSTYTHAFFTDLCRGPHVPRTKMLRHFRLLSVAGAYWRGDSNRPMLQRIYGTAFPSRNASRSTEASGGGEAPRPPEGGRRSTSSSSRTRRAPG